MKNSEEISKVLCLNVFYLTEGRQAYQFGTGLQVVNNVQKNLKNAVLKGQESSSGSIFNLKIWVASGYHFLTIGFIQSFSHPAN